MTLSLFSQTSRSNSNDKRIGKRSAFKKDKKNKNGNTTTETAMKMIMEIKTQTMNENTECIIFVHG